MNGNQSVLHVCTRTHLLGRAKQYTHLAAPYLCEQLFFLCVGICFMDETHLLRRDATPYQFFPHVVVDVEHAVIFRCAEVAEQ